MKSIASPFNQSKARSRGEELSTYPPFDARFEFLTMPRAGAHRVPAQNFRSAAMGMPAGEPEACGESRSAYRRRRDSGQRPDIAEGPGRASGSGVDRRGRAELAATRPLPPRTDPSRLG